jgi:hypothetical protein
MVGGGGYALPGVAILPGTANLLRAGVHLVVFAAFVLAVVWRNRLTVSTITLMGVGVGAVSLMAVSGMMGGGGAFVPAVSRAVLLGVMVVNVMLLLPSLLGQARVQFCEQFARSFGVMIATVVFVAVYARLVHGPFPEWTPRFGRPLNARVMGNLVLLGAVAFTAYTPRIRWGLVALTVVAATGSRLALVMIVGFLLVVCWQRRRYLILGVASVVMVGALAVAVSGSGLQVFVRTGPLAGRAVMWAAAIQDVPDNFQWGIGRRYTVLRSSRQGDEDQEGRLHNGILEATLSYGVVYAMFVFGIYVIVARRIKKWSPVSDRAKRDQQMAQWVLLVVVAESMVGTAVWTNLGDAFSLSALAMLAVTSSRSAAAHDD